MHKYMFLDCVYVCDFSQSFERESNFDSSSSSSNIEIVQRLMQYLNNISIYFIFVIVKSDTDRE